MSESLEKMEKIGKYENVEKIGEGGFGRVYKGKDPYIKRPVAIKTCDTSDPEMRKRFFREAEIAGNLHHRNITTVYDFGLEDDLPFLVQEYLSGEDLDHKIRRREFIPYPEKLHYLIQIARGLAYAHQKGVIHRDIKPSNVRILEDGTAKIMDFGIAKLAKSTVNLTRTGTTLGTAACLAPEQIRGEEVQPRADVFSFGVLAYELLSGERPFQGEEISAVIYQILHEEPKPLAAVWPNAPAEIVALVERCLSKDAAARYANGTDLLQALEAIQQGGREKNSRRDSAALDGAAHDRAALETDQTQVLSATEEPPSEEERSGSLDDVELSIARTSSISATHPAYAVAKRRSGGKIVALVTLLAVVIAGAWLLSDPQHRETLRARLGAITGSAEAPRGSASEPPSTVDDNAAATPEERAVGSSPADTSPEDTANEDTANEDTANEDTANEDTATAETKAPMEDVPAADGERAASESTEEAETPTEIDSPEGEAMSPPEEEPPPPSPPPPPPPPPPPARGFLLVEKPAWTHAASVRIGERVTVLDEERPLPLEPGVHAARIEVDEAGYHASVPVEVTVRAGETTRLAFPLEAPGALSVRALPGRPQANVRLAGEDLGTSPLSRRRTAPGEYRLVLAPTAGDAEPLARLVVVRSGMETVLTFDLESGDVHETTKILE